MRKNYFPPTIGIATAGLQAMICSSNGVYSDRGIDYGGEDEEGLKDPASRRRRDVWDDEDEVTLPTAE